MSEHASQPAVWLSVDVRDIVSSAHELMRGECPWKNSGKISLSTNYTVNQF
eukprot:COSAG02_NODE_1090_length_14647_cov_122.569425_13_plen_51_part_00